MTHQHEGKMQTYTNRLIHEIESVPLTARSQPCRLVSVGRRGACKGAI